MVIFLVIFVQLISSLKAHFPLQYEHDRGKLYAVFMGVAVSIGVRVSLNLHQVSEGYLAAMQASIHQATWFFPLYWLFYDFVATLVPFSALIFSLIYMIEKNKE